jgi:hypothetical protein
MAACSSHDREDTSLSPVGAPTRLEPACSSHDRGRGFDPRQRNDSQTGSLQKTMIIIVYGSILPPFPNNQAAIVG